MNRPTERVKGGCELPNIARSSQGVSLTGRSTIRISKPRQGISLTGLNEVRCEPAFVLGSTDNRNDRVPPSAGLNRVVNVPERRTSLAGEPFQAGGPAPRGATHVGDPTRGKINRTEASDRDRPGLIKMKPKDVQGGVRPVSVH